MAKGSMTSDEVLMEKITTIAEKVDKIEVLLTGDDGSKGLVVRMDRLEQWRNLIVSLIVVIVGVLGTFVGALLRDIATKHIV